MRLRPTVLSAMLKRPSCQALTISQDIYRLNKIELFGLTGGYVYLTKQTVTIRYRDQYLLILESIALRPGFFTSPWFSSIEQILRCCTLLNAWSVRIVMRINIY